MCQELD